MADTTSDPLKRVEEQLEKMCQVRRLPANCPAFTAFGREPAVARGKVALAQHILKDDIELDDQTYLAMSKCLLCGSCVDKCPNDVPTDEIVIAAREALAKKRGLTTFHAAVGQVIKNRSRMKMGAKAGLPAGAAVLQEGPRDIRSAAAFPDAVRGQHAPYPGHRQKAFHGPPPRGDPG